jgi:surface antigen
MKVLPLLVTSGVVATALFFLSRHFFKANELAGGDPGSKGAAGEVVTTYRKVPVRSNGEDYKVSHGKHYAKGGYYYGQKWQCVEFVKRFYHDALNHRMPDVWGHAKDFFDVEVAHGDLNPARGMLQFNNGGTTAPQADDLLVFDFAPYGHVAVISAVREDEIEVVQQNVRGRPRETYPLAKSDGRYTIEANREPIGWLRVPAVRTPADTPGS